MWFFNIPSHSNPKTDCSIEFPIPKNPWLDNQVTLHVKIGQETPEIEIRSRAGHFRYFLIFSLKKNDFFHFLSS